MASTYSDLKVELIGTGEQTGTWGTTTNNNFSVALGEAITGSADVSFSGADVTITLTDTNAAQTARNLRLNLTGTSGGARNLILGSGCQIEKLYLINNGLADAVTVKNTSGTGIAVPAGKSMFVYNNGTNVVEATSGDVFGPASSTDNAIARFDGTTGKAIQNSVVTIADSTGNMAGVGTISSGAITSSSLTSGRVLYAGTSGLIQDDADFTFNGTTVTMANDASISGLTVGKGGGAVSTNTAVGNAVMTSNTTGVRNTALGYFSVQTNSTGTDNSGLGYAALYQTTGSQNTGIGSQAATSNTTGVANSALGFNSLGSSTTGSYNTAIGTQALNSNTTASNNTAVGYQAGYSGTTHNASTLVGSQAGYSITTAQQPAFFGFQAGYSNTTGSQNCAFGDRTLRSVTTASSNSAFGALALYSNTAGLNSAFGSSVMYDNTTGTENTGVGATSLRFNTTGNYNTAVGKDSLYSNTTASYNTAVGYQSLYSNTTAQYNTALGYQAAYSTTTGNALVAIGYQALSANTGSDNTAVGFYALTTNTTGAANTAVGKQALASNTTASNNTAVGYQAGYSNTTGNQIACFGKGAGYTNTTGTDNTLLGFHAGYTLNSGGNVAVGSDALSSCTSGSLNTAVGYSGGNAITTGSKNTILGRYTGNQDGLDIRTASNYAVISDGDGNRLLSTYNGGTLALDGGAVPQSGTGITFPATQSASSNANTLDDYEEGDWTPVIADASSGGNTGTFSNNGATYTKIGRQVTIQAYLNAINTTGMTAGNVLFIRGLPFTSVGTAQGNFYTYRVGRDASTVSSSVTLGTSSTFLRLALYTTNSATVDKYILVSDMVSGTSEIIFTITYFV